MYILHMSPYHLLCEPAGTAACTGWGGRSASHGWAADNGWRDRARPARSAI